MSGPVSPRISESTPKKPTRVSSAQRIGTLVGSLEEVAASQRAAGNQATGRMLQSAIDNGSRYTLKLRIGEFQWLRTNQSEKEALASLEFARRRLYSEINIGLQGQQYLANMRTDQPLTSLVSQTLGGVSFPEVNIWDPGLKALDQADRELRAGHIKESVERLQVAGDQISAAKQKLTDYREGSITGAGRAEVALEVIQTAAAVTVSVGTGGLAGVAIGTAYGTVQNIARQGSEVSLGLRKEIDWGSVAFDTLFGLATGMFGGQVGNKVLKLLLKNQTTAALGRKVLARIASDLVSGRLSSLLMTAGRQVFEAARGRQEMTVESFIDAMVATLLDPKQTLLDVIMGEAQRRGASAVAKKRAADTQAKTLKKQQEASPPVKESTAAKQEVAAPKNESAPAKLEPAVDADATTLKIEQGAGVDATTPKMEPATDVDVTVPKTEVSPVQDSTAPQTELVAPPKQALPAAETTPAPKEIAATPPKATAPTAPKTKTKGNGKLQAKVTAKAAVQSKAQTKSKGKPKTKGKTKTSQSREPVIFEMDSLIRKELVDMWRQKAAKAQGQAEAKEYLANAKRLENKERPRDSALGKRGKQTEAEMAHLYSAGGNVELQVGRISGQKVSQVRDSAGNIRWPRGAGVADFEYAGGLAVETKNIDLTQKGRRSGQAKQIKKQIEQRGRGLGVGKRRSNPTLPYDIKNQTLILDARGQSVSKAELIERARYFATKSRLPIENIQIVIYADD